MTSLVQLSGRYLYSVFIILFILSAPNSHADASFSKLFGPQIGFSLSKSEYVHLRTGLTLKCCASTNTLYGNQTGLSGQIEVTPRRFSMQPGVAFQWRYRESGLWVVRPYYFYAYPYLGSNYSGGGMQTSTPYGGIGIEMGDYQTLLMLSWDF